MIADDAQFVTEFSERATDEPALVIDVEGFEGPLDLLLTLARQQKVDLAKISILALADQYLAFIEEARKLRLEIAADYLVMAAWLAYLKSRLLLPEQHEPDGLSAEDMATALAQRCGGLKRSAKSPSNCSTGRNLAVKFFSAASPSQSRRSSGRNGRRRSTICFQPMPGSGRSRRGPLCACPKRTVWSLAEAREAIERLIGQSGRLVRARRVSDRLHGGAVIGRDRARLELCGDTRIGARRTCLRCISTALSRRFTSVSGRMRRVAALRPNPGMFDVEASMISNVAEMRVIVSDQDVNERAEELRILEALLFAADEPLDEKALAARMPAGADVRALLLQLQNEYALRGVNIVRVGGKWSLRTAGDLAWLLTRETVVTKKLSRAAVETLAIVAYHQPVTRAEIEDIRGVSTSKGTLDVLLETGWIRLRGRRKAPGRPVTYGTTEAFMSHFGLDAITDLPGLDELKGAGLSKNRCRPALAYRCRPTIRRCAMTKTRWNRAISIWGWRRRRNVPRSEAPAVT